MNHLTARLLQEACTIAREAPPCKLEATAHEVAVTGSGALMTPYMIEVFAALVAKECARIADGDFRTDAGEDIRTTFQMPNAQNVAAQEPVSASPGIGVAVPPFITPVAATPEAADGTYDNSKTMRREGWESGRLIWFDSIDVIEQKYPAAVKPPKPWGTYPDLPAPKEAAAEPCILCNALIVQRNPTHYDADDLAAAAKRALILHDRIGPKEAAAPVAEVRIDAATGMGRSVVFVSFDAMLALPFGTHPLYTTAPKEAAARLNPHECQPSLALRAWTALSEVDYEHDPPQRILDLMYDLQLVAQGRAPKEAAAELPPLIAPECIAAGACIADKQCKGCENNPLNYTDEAKRLADEHASAHAVHAHRVRDGLSLYDLEQSCNASNRARAALHAAIDAIAALKGA